MKRYLPAILLVTLSTALIPAVPVIFTGKPHTQAAEMPKLKEFIEEENISVQAYNVLDISTGEVMEVPVRDYVIGAVCAEMPALFEPEALKAQAVAAHTYAERQRLLEQKNPTKELCGADFSNDTSKYQGYFTVSQIKRYYGENFDEYYNKVAAAADEVLPYILTYDNEPIISAFHSMSSGMTESSENAWGTPEPYLVPAESKADTSAPKYMEEVRLDRELLASRLTSGFEEITLSDDIKSWIQINEVSESGTVLTAYAGDLLVTGNDIRSVLGLRSACFSIDYSEDEIIITTRGFGHGVGMSQYGANAMAQEGKTWQDILQHYYKGCEISFAGAKE